MRAAVAGILTVGALAGCGAGPTPDTPTTDPCATVRQQVIDLTAKVGPTPASTYDYTDAQKQARREYLSSLRIIARVVADHKRCFSASEVATAEEFLASTND